MQEPAPDSVLPADQVADLLNQATLRLSPDVRLAKLKTDRLVVKYEPGARLLVLTPREWEWLQYFASGRTAASVLVELIAAQKTPSLTEFYQVLLPAVQAGILQAEGHPVPPAVKALGWPLKIPGGVVRALAVVSGLFAAGMLLWRPIEMPVHPGWLAAGWLLVCVALSLGFALAASVVRAAGGEVYRPRFAWKTPLPGLRVDWADAALGGQATRVNAALALLFPVLLAIGATAWKFPELLLSVLGGALVVLSPLWPSPLLELLGVWYRDPRVKTAFGFGIARSRLFALLTRARAQLAEPKYLFACALTTLLWLLLVLLTGAGLLRTSAHELWRRFQSADGWRYTALGVLGSLSLLIGAVLGFALMVLLVQLRSWWQERAERKLRPQAVLVSPQTIAEWLGRTLLFRHLPPAELEALAAVVRPEEHKRGSFVVREGEAGNRLYAVLSGRVEVRRDYAPGRSEPVAELGEGEIFGEIALLQGGLRTRSIRALERSILLGLDQADFERLVLTRLSRDAVIDEVQKVGFLKTIALTRDWTEPALAAFARRAALKEMPEGTAVMKEGEPNNWFYLVRRGEFSVQLKGRELRRLETGDSFGELSLLGDGLATSTVIVRSKLASCLVISGRDFVEFITRDFAAGMKWEQLRLQRVEQTKRRK